MFRSFLCCNNINNVFLFINEFYNSFCAFVNRQLCGETHQWGALTDSWRLESWQRSCRRAATTTATTGLQSTHCTEERNKGKGQDIKYIAQKLLKTVKIKSDVSDMYSVYRYTSRNLLKTVFRRGGGERQQSHVEHVDNTSRTNRLAKPTSLPISLPVHLIGYGSHAKKQRGLGNQQNTDISKELSDLEMGDDLTYLMPQSQNSAASSSTVTPPVEE